MQKNAMNATFCRLPIECSRMIEIGSSAGGGIARQYSTCGIANFRAQTREPERDAERDPDDDRDREAEQDPLEARDDVRAELREEPQVLELDEDRRRRRELRLSRCARPELPRRARIASGHRDLGARSCSASVRRAAHAAAGRCDGCQRSTRRSSAVNAKWIAMPRKPVAIASA